MTRYFLGLGSNLGERGLTLSAAVSAIAELGEVVAVSHCFETAPLGPPQPDYLNAACGLDSPLAPPALLAALLDIEAHAGRVRGEHYGPRTLDLDLLLAGDLVTHSPTLIVPHPRLLERAFVLGPLVCIAPDVRVPPHDITVRDAWRRVDASGVKLAYDASAPAPKNSDTSRLHRA